MKKLKSIFIMTLILLTGCTASGKKTIFAKESDTLSKSPCASCKKEPFYVNGRWV